MGNTCCGSTPDGAELNYNKQKQVLGDNDTLDAEAQKEQATLIIQKYYRGIITRKIMREQYGFEARHTTLNQGLTYGNTDAEIMEARRLVM